MILIFRTVIRLMGGGFSTRSIRRNQRQPITPTNVESTETEDPKPEPPTMVTDEITNEPIAESKAYILLDKEGNRRYFANWDSRQLYIQSK